MSDRKKHVPEAVDEIEAEKLSLIQSEQL